MDCIESLELGEPLTAFTPALNWIRSKTLRDTKGTRSIASAGISEPTVELLGSTSSIPSVTVTVSVVAPTWRVILTSVT